MLGVIMLGHWVSAGSFVPGSITPPITTPPQFIDQSATAQTKQGWLRLGGTGDPTTTLDVLGTAAANSIAVIGNTTVAGKLYIGANPSLSATDPALVISSGNVRSSGLVGVGDRPLCATAAGVIKVCGASTPATGVCGSANSTTPVATAPTTGLCSVGTASSITTGATAYSWTCTLGTTTPTACSVPKTTSSTATCGTVHTTTPSITLTASSLNLCTGTITPNNFSSTDPLKYTWECWNAATASSSMCYANKTATASVTWNSSACTSTVGFTPATGFSHFYATCPNATYQSNVVMTYDKELNGTVSNLVHTNRTPTTTGPNTQLGDTGGQNNTPEIVYQSPDLKTVRFRAKSGSVFSNWSQYKAYFKPADPVSATLPAKQVTLNSIIFNWALSSNENIGSLPQVISYRILACDNSGGDCITVTGAGPGSTSTFISRPVNIAFNTPYPYHTDAGTTKCTIVLGPGVGNSTLCEYYIQAYIASPFLPETTNTAGLVNRLSSTPVYYSSDIKKFP